MNVVIGLAGQIAAGKTTVATRLAARLGIPRVSFGDEVRRIAAERGLPADRAVLQDLGDELIASGWDSFCRAVLAQAPWQAGQSLVIDGIRHMGAIVTLQQLVAPSPLVIVFLEAAPEARRARLASREPTAQGPQSADGHPNESELHSVRRVADLVLPNPADPDLTVTALLPWIALQR